jgi:lipid-A-disaccharide synthase-like uncharacterized protein
MLIDLWHQVGGYLYDVLVNRLDSLSWLGGIAQLMFASRFLVQWIASERAGRSVVPLGFWLFSIGGGLLMLIYVLFRRDLVLILGQALPLIIYLRNLDLVMRERRALRGSRPS